MHADWALSRIGGRQAVDALEYGLSVEEHPAVVEEIDMALHESKELVRSA